MKSVLYSLMIIATTLSFSGCGAPLDWPDSPLHRVPSIDTAWKAPADKEAAMQRIAGHYAHYDVVSYEDTTTKTPMKTFVISYGFTDFYIQDGRLYQKDSFCHAEQVINQKSVQAFFNDEATQAIKPRVQEVTLEKVDGVWNIYRPASPTLLGIDGDPSLPLSTNKNDPLLIDPDGDGHPGVTVELLIGGIMRGKIFITRREIYTNHVTLHSDGNLYGNVIDQSEQFVVDATMKVLRQQSSPIQNPDPGMNPVFLIRIPDEIDTCEELMQNRDKYFPQAPRFH